MDLLTRLPEEDKDLIHRYIAWYGGGDCECDYCAIDRQRMDYFLRFWAPAKAPFYKMFGEKFIIKREISFSKSEEDLEEEMDDILRRCAEVPVMTFRRDYLSFIDDYHEMPYELRYNLKRFVGDTTMLVRNVYDGDPFVIPAQFTKDNKPLQVNAGAKVIKMLGKICNALGFSVKMYHCETCGGWDLYRRPGKCHCGCDEPLKEYDGYESFRRAHSLALNQKMVRGNLCLSIHPLDFITMSDNDCGWSSCMSWMEEAGDYRLGTIEMMNSESVIIAYIEAKEDICIANAGDKWNNKRWRQLIVVTPELILGNKQYPYFNDVVQGTALKWIRDLAASTDFSDTPYMSYGPYDEESVQINNQNVNVIGNRRVHFNLYMGGYMYNDIYDLRLGFLKRNWDGTDLTIDLSGPAVCTSCGDIISCDDVESSWTTCRDCNGMWRCSRCGDWHYGEPYYAEDSDHCFCEYCYSHELHECEVCGDRVEHINNVFLELIPAEKCPEDLVCYNWTYVIRMCDYCMRRPEDYEITLGELKETTDMWGRTRIIAQLENVNDEGLSRGDLPDDVYMHLTEIRDAKSIEEKIALVRKYID